MRLSRGLYRCSIQQFIVIFFFAVIHSPLRLSVLSICDSLQNTCSFLLTVFCKGTCFSFGKKRHIYSFIFVTLHVSLLWKRCRYKTGGGQMREVEAEVGGREDCVAISLRLSWDLKLWSGSFRLSLMSAALCDSFHFLSWQIAEKQSQEPYWF